MIITITGTEGSGKTTLSRSLSKALDLPYIYVGGIRRKMAEERGMTLAEFNKLGETDPSTDVDVDNRIVEEAKNLDSAIIEGRTMFHFFPKSLKIFLTIDLDEAAKRIYNDPSHVRKNEASGFESIEQVKKNIIARRETDNFRYKKYYGIDAYDPKNFDFVLDTTDLTPGQTLAAVTEYVKKNSK